MLTDAKLLNIIIIIITICCFGVSHKNWPSSLTLWNTVHTVI